MESPVLEGFRLSPQQKEVWRAWRGESAPAVQAAISIEGPLDRERLRRAWSALVARHEILRTRFERVPDVVYPLQVIDEPSDPGFREEAGGMGWSAPESRIGEALATAARGLEDGTPVALSFSSLSSTSHRLLVIASPLAADGASVDRLVGELAGAYGEDRPEPGVPEAETLQYADYAEWRLAQLEEQAPETIPGAGFWRSLELASVPPLDLRGLGAERTGDRPGGVGAAAEWGSPMLPELARKVRETAGAVGVPLQALLSAAWQVLLARRAGGSRFLLLHALDPPPLEGAESCLGPLRALLPHAVSFDGAEPFESLARRTGERLQEYVLQHDHAALLREGERGRPGASFELVESGEHRAGDCRFRLESLAVPGRPRTVGFCVLDSGGTLAPALVRDPRLCSPEGAERLLREMDTLLEGAVEAPDRPVGRLPLLDAGEARHVLVDWNDTAADSPNTEETLHGLFEAQVERTPEAPAAVFEGESWSYRGLDARAGRLAGFLLERGIEADEPVGLCLSRGLLQLEAAFGVLKAGGAYAALPPTDPPERLRRTLASAGIRTVLTEAAVAGELAEASTTVLSLDRPDGPGGLPGRRALDGRDPGPSSASVGSGQLAYVLFTSGSSGPPKGVMVEHRSVLNLWRGLRCAIFEPCPPAQGRPWRVGVNAPLSFDASVKQLVHLLDGHCLHVLPDDVRLDPASFLEYQRRWDLDVIDLTPSQLRPLVEAGAFRADGAPRCALVGGEPIDPELWQALCDHEGTAFFNVYGPTECTVDVTIGRVLAGAPEPHMGRPIGNVRVYLLDEHRQPVPAGAPGEIHVSGAGLARGYLGDHSLTEERFVSWEGPHGVHERLYRTGDLAHHLADGSLVFRGRLDHQVKLRGHRVDLGEVESALESLPDLREAAVLLEREGDEACLVAYAVPADHSAPPPPSALRDALAVLLPEHMVPAVYVTLEALPLTSNGKVDRTALAQADERKVRARGPYVAPASREEEMLAELWEEILGIDRISVEENFFDVGGHSLLAVQLHSRIQEELGSRLTVIELFRHPTIRSMARFLANDGGEPGLEAVRDRGARQRAAVGGRQTTPPSRRSRQA